MSVDMLVRFWMGDLICVAMANSNCLFQEIDSDVTMCNIHVLILNAKHPILQIYSII